MSKFETTTEILHDAAIVRVSGYLSGHGGERLEGEVDRLLGGESRRIVIDFSDTDLVNSVGVSILIGVIEKVRDAHGKLFFTGMTPVNEEIFRLMGLHKHVPFVGRAGAPPVDKGAEEGE